MKKNFLLTIAIACMCLGMLTSSRRGAGIANGFNATGSEYGLGNITGCTVAGCHAYNADTGIKVSLELDSAGIPVTHYRAGRTYMVKITGTNNTALTLPKFGFQVSCVKGTTIMVTPTNAGRFDTTGLPANVRYTASIPSDFVCNLIEHSAPIAATTGTGDSGTTYVVSFPWIAPAAGTGSISFWGALCAVNNDSASGGDAWNTNKVIIMEHTSDLATSHTANKMRLCAFPNPVINNLNLQINNAETGIYSLQVFDMNGKNVMNENISFSAGHSTAINTSTWPPGTYHVMVSKDGNSEVLRVVKK